MKFTFKKTVEATLMSIGVAKFIEILCQTLFYRHEDHYYETCKHLFQEALAILIVFILVLKFDF